MSLHNPSKRILVASFQAVRPRQWIKNSLVLAAPLFAGTLFQNFTNAVLAILAFIFASSLGYLFNDWQDRNLDSFHKTKRIRPFASGALNFQSLIVLSSICITGMVFCVFFLPRSFVVFLSLYLVVTLTYSIRIKNIPVVEMFWIAAGFLVRSLAGTTLVGEQPSGYFFGTVFFGAMFIVSCKRRAEAKRSDSIKSRKVLRLYSSEYLNNVAVVSLAAVVVTYSLWVTEVPLQSPLSQVSIITFTFMFMRYYYESDQEIAEAPEDLIFSSGFLLISTLLTFVILLIVFYS